MTTKRVNYQFFHIVDWLERTPLHLKGKKAFFPLGTDIHERTRDRISRALGFDSRTGKAKSDASWETRTRPSTRTSDEKKVPFFYTFISVVVVVLQDDNNDHNAAAS